LFIPGGFVRCTLFVGVARIRVGKTAVTECSDATTSDETGQCEHNQHRSEAHGNRTRTWRELHFISIGIFFELLPIPY
jgi:hypothetical protein